MHIFETVKASVPPGRAAEHYGLNVSRNGMTSCPFHEDRHPSMKLYDDHYHCFGCQARGDVIDFTARLFGTSNGAAAQKLAADFGIREGKPSVPATLKTYKTQAENEKLCFRVLQEYLHILQNWKKKYAPQTPEDVPDPRFVEACQMLECMQYMVDLLTVTSAGERTEVINSMMKDDKITLLQERLQKIKEEANEPT
ncbi:MAG: DNA primase [Ruminococcus sp.]|nr:DNA primase [Ruminococcus sp.]